MQRSNLFSYFKNDVRWLVLLFLWSFALFALQWPGFTRTPDQFFLSIMTGILVDLAFLYVKRVGILPLSGVITSTGVFLLCDSPHKWMYPLLVALSIASKHLLKIQGRHIFNPTNLGVVLGAVFLAKYMTITTGSWGGMSLGFLGVSALGIAVMLRAKRAYVSISYVLTFFLGVLLRQGLLHRTFLSVAAPMTGAGFQLFVFFMIPDPATTPKKASSQILFGLALGCLDTFLRYQQFKYAPFFSLMIVCAAYASIEEGSKVSQRVGSVRV